MTMDTNEELHFTHTEQDEIENSKPKAEKCDNLIIHFIKKFLILIFTYASRFSRWFSMCTDCGQISGKAGSSFENFEVESVNLERECWRHPGHSDFIPVKDFKMDHLPEKYKDEQMIECVRLLSELTVLVKVTRTDGEYVFGTGKVCDILERTSTGKCQCNKCNDSASSKPNDQWWLILVRTSSDLVLDEQNTMQATCRLFYNDLCVPLVTIDVQGIVASYFSVPVSEMPIKYRDLVCVTCDRTIASRLKRAVDNFTSLFERSLDKYYVRGNKDKLVVMITHIHGCPQRVTVGRTRTKREMRQRLDTSTYTNTTCPGSCGAYLLQM